MVSIVWKNFIGQERVKEILSSVLQSGRLGHAYLFVGAEGTGKLQAAVELGMALLCDSAQDCPCYRCVSCRRVLSHTHPDFHLVFPVVLSPEHKTSDMLNEAAWEFLAKEAKRRLETPYLLTEYDGGEVIPVDWIREANQAIRRGPLEGKRCVTIIDGIDMMSKESANAMLKTLEEPPPFTLVVLLTDRPGSVLPTVESRCQVLRFGYLTHAQIEEGLRRFGYADLPPEVMEQIAAFAMGSLGRALVLAGDPMAEAAAPAVEFWRGCMSDDQLRLAAQIDQLAARKKKTDENGTSSACMQLLMHIAYAARMCALKDKADAEKYIPNQALVAEIQAATPTVEQVAKVLQACQRSISALRVHGNPALVLCVFAQTVSGIFHEQKQ